MSQRPGPIFSTAQAYRRLYTTDRKVDTLRRAVQNYKLYIDKQKAGGRIGEAQQALRDLEPLLNDLLAGNAAGAAASLASSATDTKPKTRLMVSSSTKGALASLDGGEPAELPLIQELTPGPHKLRLTAEGYVDDERDIVAFEGQVFGLDVSLRERPALLTIGTDSGADVSIDGRNEGTTPLPKALEIAPGTRLVTITKTGYRPFSAEIDFRRDERRPLEVKLQQTTQRTASFVVGGAALAGLAAGGIITGLAAAAEGRAREIEGFISQRNLTAQELNDHISSVQLRNELRVAAVATFGGAALLGLMSVGMFIFDSSPPGLPTRIRDEQKKPEAARQPKVGFSVTPWVSPALAGGSVQFRF
ncbi:MAG: PEGA domain-containing protein [Polyangiaceae bacterium]|nr:PEGA domain-containing protein [Polyangiaceae bacterium]